MPKLTAIIRLIIVALSGSVHAQGATEGDLRLVDGITNTSGRVEIYHDGNWGTICGNNFGVEAARVVCTQLGYGDTRPQVWRSAPAGRGEILLEMLQCTGRESTLTKCGHRPWGLNKCRHGEDIGVECDGRSFVDNLRLVDGTTRSGRLEVNYAGRWGTICAENFDRSDAKVACRALGFGTAVSVVTNMYGNGDQDQVVNAVVCRGNETSLSECRFGGPFIGNCRQGDVGIHCIACSTLSPLVDWTQTVVPHEALSYVLSDTRGKLILYEYGQTEIDDAVANMQARLNGGSDVSGRLELSLAGIWGSVCDDGFDNNAAKVACRMLNQPTEHALAYKFSFTKLNLGSSEIWLDDVHCNGTEESLMNCTHRDITWHDCQHKDDIGVFCTDDVHADHHHEVRLSGRNSTERRGRLEVLYYGIWGTVCRSTWTTTNNAVMCRSLHLTFENASRTSIQEYGLGTGPIWLDHLQCNGDETTLFDCQHGIMGYRFWCAHSQDVAMICEW